MPAVVSVAEMRALEAAATAAGTSEAQLQEHAGAAVAAEVARLLSPGDAAVVLVGRGNNGRDGALAAGWLARRGVPVALCLVEGHAVNPDEVLSLRDASVRIIAADRTEEVRDALAGARVAVDALAGIGTRGALREPLLGVARLLNAARKARGPALAVVALDIPSGIDSDSGAVPGVAVTADVTVTLGAVKRGLLCFPAAEHVGRLVVRDIGIPPAATRALAVHVLLESELAPTIPVRPADAHKYQHGRAILVVGCDQYPGAAALAASACVRAGAGLVTVFSTPFVRSVVASHVLEATYLLDEDEATLSERMAAGQALVVGCGLGRDDRAIQLVHLVLEQHERLRKRGHPVPTLVLDGDGLYALTLWDRWWERLSPAVILTPHAGELQRLVESSMWQQPNLPRTSFVWEEAGRIARAFGCVLVSKGPFTSVADPRGQVEVWTRPNGALATAGTGDVLAGLIGGLAAQGAAPWDAARAGVAAHARAAEALMAVGQVRSIAASDLVPQLPRQLALLQSALSEPLWPHAARLAEMS